MIFHDTGVCNAWIVEPERFDDDRGFFARISDREEFAAHGMAPEVVQANLSYSSQAGTVRGMHWTIPPAAESKYIRVVRGSVLDVIIDLRPWSSTYLERVEVELSADNRLAIYVPPGFAHGHQTLTDDSEMLYFMGAPYTPGLERGAPHDDATLGHPWPLPVAVMSDKDRSWPTFDRSRHESEMTRP